MPEAEHKLDVEEVLKSKVSIMYSLALTDKWFNGDNIFMSVKIPSSNSFYISNFKSNNEVLKYPNFTKINKNDLDFEISNINSLSMFLIHFLIHNSEIDIQYITFINNIHVLEISKTEHGLLPISQESFIIDSSSIAIFDFPEFLKKISKLIAIKNEDILQEFLLKYQRDFQQMLSKNNKLFLKDLGCLVVGKTIEKVYYDGYLILYACKTQIKLGNNINYSNLIEPSKEVQNSVNILLAEGNDKAVYTNLQDKNISWNYGEMEFEALVRGLDNMDLQSDYDYKLKSPWKI